MSLIGLRVWRWWFYSLRKRSESNAKRVIVSRLTIIQHHLRTVTIMRRKAPLISNIHVVNSCVKAHFCIIAFLFHLLLIMNLLNFLSTINMLAIVVRLYKHSGHTKTPPEQNHSLRCRIFLSQHCHRNIIKLNIKVSAAIRQFAFCTILNKLCKKAITVLIHGTASLWDFHMPDARYPNEFLRTWMRF